MSTSDMETGVISKKILKTNFLEEEGNLPLKLKRN